MRKTKKSFLVIGASSRQTRYANLAIKRLTESGQQIIAIGRSGGEICGIQIQNTFPDNIRPDIVLMYLSKANQKQYENILIELKPEKIIFNPGAENREFAEKLKNNGTQVVESCALVMMSINKL